MTSPSIRPMTHTELSRLVRWAAVEGWNPGLHDADLFWNSDPEGFLTAVHHDQMIGGGAIVKHSSRFGFMGLFIINQEHRGRGLGRELWYARRDFLLERLGENATIGLDGVDAMVPFYAKGGFSEHTRHRRFELLHQGVTNDAVPNIRRIAEVDFTEICKLDEACFPAQRTVNLRSWLQQPDALAFASEADSGCQGFAVMRKCLEGWKIGPLFSKDQATAKDLCKTCLAHAMNQSVFIDVPDDNPNAVALSRELPSKEVFGCTRMYLGPKPEIRTDWIYGISTLETG